MRQRQDDAYLDLILNICEFSWYLLYNCAGLEPARLNYVVASVGVRSSAVQSSQAMSMKKGTFRLTSYPKNR